MAEAARRSHDWGWASRLGELVVESPEVILEDLRAFLPDAGPAQRTAWRDSLRVLQDQGGVVIRTRPPAAAHGTIMEYELPREGGRRPDVLVLQSGHIVVLEFKGHAEPRRADVDQVRAYARDLSHYHSESHGIPITPVLVLPGQDARHFRIDGAHVVTAAALAKVLLELDGKGGGAAIDLDRWLHGEYAPLPTLVAAARLLFERLPLPFIRRAHSAGVPESVELVLSIAGLARARGERHLTLLTGVPGAGKTLVGLQVAHSRELEEWAQSGNGGKPGAPATFLSGNGPLIQVLQNALSSKAFVQDMHRYIRDYGLKHRERVPPEPFIVFDEAQRAWDARKVEDFYTKKLGSGAGDLRRSEPRMLVEIAERLPDWAMVLGLVGGGQEIHTGEEGGMALWVDALADSNEDWIVHGPPGLESRFRAAGHEYLVHPELSLDTTLRSHAAADLHEWARLLLDENDLTGAGEVAARLRAEAFPIYVTQDLDRAREYAWGRFRGESLRRYGFLASSKSRALLPYGLDPTFQATRRVQVGPWFNAKPSDPRSCCRLDSVVTEFQAQGLELDLPLVCWGEDFLWQDGSWHMKPVRKQKLVDDPMRLRTNAYRVLLTRGREGLVVFVPPEDRFLSTMNALVAAGCVGTGAAAGDRLRVADERDPGEFGL